MRKSFDELTITDDYMFCTVLQDEALCKTLLQSVLGTEIGEIKNLTYQKTITAGSKKSIRLDVCAGDSTGTIYDIEMQTTNEKNLANRMRYYQAALDVSILNKGMDYNELPRTYILFFCPFDYIGAGLSKYTFKSICEENKTLALEDGTTKILLNSKAAGYEADSDLKAFLEYMNGQKNNNEFITKLDHIIQEIKQNDERRQEYMMLSAFEADVRRQGIQQGIQQGVQQSLIKTVLNMKESCCDNEFIAKITGLSVKEIEKINK